MNKPQLVYLKLEKRLTTHSPLLLRLRTSLPGCDPDLLSMFGANLYAAAITSELLTADYAWLHLCRGKNVTAHSFKPL
jgi:hypothetical protein